MNSAGGKPQIAGAVAFGGHNNAASAQFEEDDWVQLTDKGRKMVADGMAHSIVRLQRELDEANARIALLEEERSILLRERDEAQALVAEMKQAIIWAKAEAKERLHRLDQAACERRTWLEAHEKMKRERDELRQKNKTLAQCWRDAEQERDEFRMRLESRK